VKPYTPLSALFNAKSILLDVQFDGGIIRMNERAAWISRKYSSKNKHYNDSIMFRTCSEKGEIII